MVKQNLWFESCKQSLGKKVSSMEIGDANGVGKQVHSVVKEEFDAMTFEGLLAFASLHMPDMELDEETSVYRLIAILSTIYLNDRIQHRLGAASRDYRVFVA